MAAIVCAIHGTTIATLVSPDIREDFLSNKQGPLEKYYPIKVIMFDNIDPVIYCWCSSSWVEQLGIPVNKILSFDEFSNYEELPLEPICGKCFRDWMNKQVKPK